MEKKSSLLIGLTWISFLALTLIKFINRFVTIPGYENKFRSLSNHVPNEK